MFNLEPWEPRESLWQRADGEIGFRKNGDSLDIWIRITGRPTRFSVSLKQLIGFLLTPGDTMEVLEAESNGDADGDIGAVKPVKYGAIKPGRRRSGRE